MTKQSSQIGPDVCCADWDRAREDGTDSEEYGPLIDYSICKGGWSIGPDSPAVAFCPWCGARKTSAEE